MALAFFTSKGYQLNKNRLDYQPLFRNCAYTTRLDSRDRWKSSRKTEIRTSKPFWYERKNMLAKCKTRMQIMSCPVALVGKTMLREICINPCSQNHSACICCFEVQGGMFNTAHPTPRLCWLPQKLVGTHLLTSMAKGTVRGNIQNKTQKPCPTLQQIVLLIQSWMHYQVRLPYLGKYVNYIFSLSVVPENVHTQKSPHGRTPTITSPHGRTPTLWKFPFSLNRAFPISLGPLFQSESKCEIILMKMTLICMKMNLHAELIFISKVSHLDSLWNKGTRNWPIFQSCSSLPSPHPQNPIPSLGEGGIKNFLELHNELLNTCSIIVEAGQKLHKLFFVFHQDFMDLCCFIGVCNKYLKITK